jgi:hypothetical protein
MANQKEERYEKDGMAKTLIGTAYQVKLTMLLFKKALDQKYKFKIAAERKGAGKFDDLEIQIEDTNVHRLYQIKHVEDETSNRISAGNLENLNDSRFSIPMYFTSYRLIKDSLKSSGMSFDLIIFTNTRLEEELRKHFTDSGKDELLDMKNFNFKKTIKDKKNLKEKRKQKDVQNPEQLKFKRDKKNQKDVQSPELLKLEKDSSYREILGNVLKKTSDLERLKTKLVDLIGQKKDIDFKDKMIKKYQKPLLDIVFDEKEGKFHRDFLESDSNLSEGAKELRSCLKDNFGENIFNLEIKIGKHDPLSKKMSEGVDLPNDKIDDEEINDFLDRLVLAVNQPNETELDVIINKTMGENINTNLLDCTFIANEVHVKIVDWTKKEEGSYLTPEMGEEIFKNIRETISKLALTGPTIDYCKKLESYGIFFRYVPDELEDFLNSSTQDNEPQILHLENTCNSLFSSIKVYQTLKGQRKYDKNDSYVFSPFENIKRIRTHVLEAFKSSDLLVIEFTDPNDNMDESFASEILEMLSSNKQKRLVLISFEDYTQKIL